MANKALLCVSSMQATVALGSNGKLLRCEVFNNDETGRLAFDAFLQNFPRTPVYVMIDAVEEDYRFETLPHTFGRDRRDILLRRLKQLYRNTPYYSASWEGRDASKRRDDQYLFAALTNQEVLYDWLNIIETRESPLAGIYLLPLVSNLLLAKLRVKQPNVLLVSQNSAGLRQSFFRNQKLRISRLTPLETTFGRSRISTYAEEIANTRLYLDPLRVMPRDELLTIVIIDRDGSLAELHRTLSAQSPTGHCLYWGAADLIAKTGISAGALATSPDSLFLYVLGLQKPQPNLAGRELTLRYVQHQSRRFIYLLSICTMLGLLSWSALNLYLQQNDNRRAKDLATAATKEQQEYFKVTQGFPASPTSAENLKKAVETAKAIRSGLRTPEEMLSIVSQALTDNPDIYLRKITWAYDRQKTLPAEFKQAVPRDVVARDEQRQIGLVEGEIRPFKGDYRLAIETINTFAQRLAKDKMVDSVNVIDLPLNASSTNALSGSTSQKDETTATAVFKLAVVFKQGL